MSEREKLKKSLCTCFPQQSKCKFSRIRKPAKQIFIQRFFFSGDENSRLFLCENENFIFALLLLLSHCDFLCALLFLCDVLFEKTHTHTHTILLHITLNCLVGIKKLYTGKSDLIDGYKKFNSIIFIVVPFQKSFF